MRVASGRMRLRSLVVNVPTPGPYSTMTRALSQSTCLSTPSTTKGELGSIHPTMFGCLTKLHANRKNCEARLGCFVVTWLLEWLSQGSISFFPIYNRAQYSTGCKMFKNFFVLAYAVFSPESK